VPYSWSDPHGFTAGESVGLATWLGQLGGDLWYLRDRVDWPYQNTSGGDLATGLLLIQDTGDEAALTLPAALVGEAGPFWVTLAPILDGASGYAARTGVVVLNYLGPDPVPGDRLQTSSLAGYCQTGILNAFATALTTGHSGLLYALLDGPGGSGGGGGGSGDATSIQGEDVDPATPAEGDVLTYTGGLWVPTAPSGGGGGGSGSNATWDPYGNAVPPVASAFSVHDHWSGSGILTRLDQNTDNMVFYNPYTVTACLVPNLVEIDYCSISLCLRASGSDKRIIFRLVHNTTLKVGDLYFDDYQTLTGGSGTPSGDLGWTQGFPIWLRFRDNASNMFYEYSRDGENWVIYQTKATGIHATMDQAGVTMDSFTGGSGSAYSVAVLSFAILNTA
jgi:hypothetical protein